MDNIQLNFFQNLQSLLEEESDRKNDIQASVKNIDLCCRNMSFRLNAIQADPTGPVPQVAFDDIQKSVKALETLVPENEYYRYNGLWHRSVQQAVFLAVFKHYLDTEELIDLNGVERCIGVKVDLHNNMTSFHIQLEDVLHGYISLISELSRLAVNAVTVGDYGRPIRISKFVKDLSGGFQLLNLKNDNLRKRFDGIKYDVKKIEEVVYDITLRGLYKQ
ncbi:translin [Phycomyces nitens]|nr:translin [Phycomyces nitens]